MTDNIQNYEVSKEKLITGIKKVYEIIKPTYGAGGGNVAIETDLKPFHRIINDGKVITDSIYLADPIEQMGVNILQEACEKQEKEAGDGRKTTIILTTELLNQSFKGKPLEIKRRLDRALPKILKAIDRQKKEISVNEISKVAKIASESEEIGQIIGEIYPKIGKEGIIEIEASNLPKTYYEIVEGVRVRTGWLGGYWQTEPDKCVVEKPKILITREKITATLQLERLYKDLASKGTNQIVLYCEDIDLGVASQLAVTSLRGQFKTLIIKAPILWKDWLYEDLARATGATPIDLKNGKTFANFTVDDLGTCDKLVATQDEVRLIGIKDLTDYLKTLEKKGLEDNQQLVRASWLKTKVAVLKVGANSESELTWKIKKAKDACHASYYALQDGIVPGAGYCLGKVDCPLLTKVLRSPQEQIEANLDQPITVRELERRGIVDPALVVKSAITNAISIAGIVLTTKGAIIIPPELKEFARKMAARVP